MIKAVLFDFDGVLTTDATGSESICKYISIEAGIEYTLLLNTYRQYNRDLLYGFKTHVDIWEEFCQSLGIKIDIRFLHDSFISTPIDVEMEELVFKLKKSGYIIGMITDNKKDRIDAIVEYKKWNRLFDAITISACVGSAKSSEIIFSKTLSDITLKADECVFIDNNHKNLTIPESMGMNTIYFDDIKRDMTALENSLIELGIKMQKSF